MSKTDEVARAKDRALRLLAVRPRSRRELADRLGRQGVGAEVIRRVLADLARVGLVDDAAFARRRALDRMGRGPVGRRRLEAELLASGVDRRLVAQVLDEVYRGADEAELALQAARNVAARYRDLPREARLRRLYAYLVRQGFAVEAATGAALRAAGGPGDGEDGPRLS